MASVRGTFFLRLSDGSTCDISMYYCPSLVDTIVFHQHFTRSAIPDRWYNGYRLVDMLGCCRILLLHTHDNDMSFIALQKSNNFYFVAGLAPGPYGSRVSCLATKPQLLSDLWHQCIGHPGQTQLSLLAKHSTGLPSQLTAGLHPMYSCQECNDGNIHRAPIGPTSDTAPLLSGTRFHLNFGFIRASSADFGVSVGNHVVTSYAGNNTYLLALNGLKSGPIFLCMDQAGELWRSNQLRDVSATAGYAMEPTGSDAASENGKVDRPNGTFGVMVLCLLYSAGLSAFFWYAALVHAAYFKNRLYHKALYHTLYEAWTGENPPLTHLRTFGALIMARKPGKWPAKDDRRTAHGLLVGYCATTKHVR
jgi:hypothetical protein